MIAHRETRRGDGKVRLIVLHWTGGNGDAAALGKYWQSADANARKVSSHYGVDEHGAQAYLPETAQAYHAGEANAVSIGIDVCQHPQSRSAVMTRGLIVDKLPGGFLTLHPSILANTAKLVRDVCKRHGLPIVCAPLGAAPALSTAWVSKGVTVVGHHHLTARKVDILPWWPQILEALK